MSADAFSRQPIDPAALHTAALEAWLAEVFEVPADLPKLSGTTSSTMRALVGDMRETLVPIAPSPDFVQNLGRSLAQAASQRQQPLRRRYRRAVWFGLAAAGSVASIVGVTAYVMHQRDRQQA
jgi:hypothetical protein